MNVQLTLASHHPHHQLDSHPLGRQIPRAKSVPHALLTPRTTLTAFLAVGWSAQVEPAFGQGAGDASIKAKLINLISAVRVLMRSKW